MHAFGCLVLRGLRERDSVEAADGKIWVVKDPARVLLVGRCADESPEAVREVKHRLDERPIDV